MLCPICQVYFVCIICVYICIEICNKYTYKYVSFMYIIYNIYTVILYHLYIIFVPVLFVLCFNHMYIGKLLYTHHVSVVFYPWNF